MRFLQTVCGLGLLVLSSFAAGQPPKLRLAEVQEAAPTAYRVDLTLDPAKSGFSGSVAISVSVSRPTETIWLNANRIQVQEASFAAGGKTLAAKVLPGGEDFVGLQFPAAVPAGSGELRIRYTGGVRPDSSSVFHVKDQGNDYIFTQFESTDARGAFPCFDEPSYKTPWQLTLHVPAADKAVSNTPVTTDNVSGGTRTVAFGQTKPLPSYLVAFAVGPFEFVDAGVAGRNRFPVRIVAPKGRAAEAKYAASVTAEILTRLENYFGIPFPYEKSDQVAVPVTNGFGAMENAGMVTYNGTMILANPENDSINRQRGYAEVAAHELAHQWFGDLVTTEWWNDIWLNEAFATWMEQKLIAEWKPEWKTRVDEVDSKLFAEGEDSLMTARKIRQPIETKGDIGSAFDGITYQKGAAVIGMFESWMGPDKFRAGVQSYLKRYAFRNATAPDFLDALASTGNKQITAAFSTFLNQAGVPLLAASVDCGHGTPSLHLEQSRSLPLGSKGSANQTWQIPVCIRYPGGGGTERECMLVTEAKTDWQLKAAQACPAWVEVNDRAKGYYRAEYGGGLLKGLAEGDVTHRLDAPERVNLIGDAQAMAGAGKISAADALRLAEAFHADPERHVVELALGVASWPHGYFVPADLEPNYERFLRKNFQARARELGWTPKPGEPDDVRLLRPRLVRAVATLGADEELGREASRLAGQWLENHKAVSPEVVSAVLNTAAYYGNLALFKQYLAAFQKTQDPQEKQRLLGGMSSFRDRAAVEAGFQAVLSHEVPLVDGASLLLGGGQGYAPTRKMSFEFIKAHFDEIMKGHPVIFGFDLGSFLPRAGESFCDAQSRDELQAFFGPKVGQYPGAPRALAQVVEGIDLCIAGKAAQEPSVAAFLKNY